MPRTWLVLHGGALGDLVLTIHLAVRLPGTRQAGRIDLVSRTNPGDLRACHPRILRRSSEGLGLHWLFGEANAAAPGDAAKVSAANPAPDQLRTLIRGRHVLNALAGPESSVHRRLAALEPARLLSLDPRPGHTPPAALEQGPSHIVDQWQARLEAQGELLAKCVTHGRGPHLGIPGELRQAGHDLFRRAGCGQAAPVLIHPGSGGRAKCWPLTGFLEVARGLQRGGEGPKASPGGIGFLVGPAEVESWPTEHLQTVKSSFPLLIHPSPDELLAALAGARAYVGNDAGPTHLAALLGTPTVALFGPTSAGTWRPLGPAVRVLAGKPAVHAEDWGITPDKVVAAVWDAIPSSRPNPGR